MDAIACNTCSISARKLTLLSFCAIAVTQAVGHFCASDCCRYLLWYHLQRIYHKMRRHDARLDQHLFRTVEQPAQLDRVLTRHVQVCKSRKLTMSSISSENMGGSFAPIHTNVRCLQIRDCFTRICIEPQL